MLCGCVVWSCRPETLNPEPETLNPKLPYRVSGLAEYGRADAKPLKLETGGFGRV